jgi:hypothetical protein
MQEYSYTALGRTYRVWIEKTYYANGRTAIILNSANGQVACATVNLPEHNLAPDQVHIKTWSENEGMLDFLIKHHIVSDCGMGVPYGYCMARVCKLLI